MSTKAQIKANRQNAQKSTGPKTPEGKEISSQNSTKHGLLSHRNIISSESQAEFDLHRTQFLEELQPETPIQSFLADRIVSLSWRLIRAEIIQNQAIDYLDEKDNKSPIVKMTQAMLLKIYPVPEDDDPPLNVPLGNMAIKDYYSERALDRLLLYERRIENSLHKTIKEFERQKQIKKPINSNCSNEPNLSKRPVLRSLPPAKKQPNLAQHTSRIKHPESSIEQKMSNEPNPNPPEPVTHYPTSNYGKFQRLQKPKKQPKSAIDSFGEGVKNPLSSYNFSDQEWEQLLAVAKEEKKKLKTTRSRNY